MKHVVKTGRPRGAASGRAPSKTGKSLPGRPGSGRAGAGRGVRSGARGRSPFSGAPPFITSGRVGPGGRSGLFRVLAALGSLALLALAVFAMVSCGLSRPYPAARSFTLTAGGPGDPAQAPAQDPAPAGRVRVVEVAAAGAAAACETRKMVFRVGPDELAEDFYNEFAGLPARMVADAAAARLDRSGRFRAGRSTGLEPPDLVLEVFVGAFHGDLTAEPPAARLEVRFTLSDARRRRTLLSRTYRSVRPMIGAQEDRPAALAAALGLALGDVLAGLEADLEAAAHGPR